MARHNQQPLSRARVIRAAIALADEKGLGALSMRKLGQTLGVKAMSLYNHVANKDDMLDEMVDILIAEVAIPEPGDEWKSAMRKRAHSARQMFERHPWATSLMESRTHLGPAGMRYYNAIIGCLREAGFDIAAAAHAFSVLDSYVYGFALQELNLPVETEEDLAEVATEMLSQLPAEQFPYFVEMITEHALKPGYSYATEFEWGLELILDGLDATLEKTRKPTGGVR